MPPGRERTLKMTSLTAEARAVARATPLALVDLQNMLATGGQGERVLALAVLQDQPDPRLFPLVSAAIASSASAFEQYQALGAAYELAAMLNERQREELARVLDAALEDPQRAIHADASRARLVEALRSAVNR